LTGYYKKKFSGIEKKKIYYILLLIFIQFIFIEIKTQSQLSGNLYKNRLKHSSPPNPLDVNTGNVVSHISKELESALSTLI